MAQTYDLDRVLQTRLRCNSKNSQASKTIAWRKMPFWITFQLSNNSVARFQLQKVLFWRKLSFFWITFQFSNNFIAKFLFQKSIAFVIFGQHFNCQTIPWQNFNRKKCCSGAHFINSLKCFVMEMQIRVPVWEGKNSGRKKKNMLEYHFECP